MSLIIKDFYNSLIMKRVSQKIKDFLFLALRCSNTMEKKKHVAATMMMAAPEVRLNE